MSNFQLKDIEDILKPKSLDLVSSVRVGNIVPTKRSKDEFTKWQRNIKRNINIDHELENDFHLSNNTTLTEEDAIEEASRCLKCADAPCQKGCPSSVDIKAFITCIQNHNYYGAAKIILSENPVGYSCGLLCMTSDLCAGCCNLSNTHRGPINISGLQEFALQRYRRMGIRASRPKLMISDSNDNTSRIAIIGSGPSSLSCATYLARLGYNNITIFEKNSYAGGVGSSEIPQFRLPASVVAFEVQQVKDLGVQFEYNKSLGNNLKLEDLKKNYDAVYIGVGKMQPKKIDALKGSNINEGYYDSKSFLMPVAHATKNLPNIKKNEFNSIRLKGRVLVLGAGDVAMDCARTAYRCGAERVTICLRRNTNDIRATEEEVELARMDHVDLIPYALPKQIIKKTNEHNELKICGLELYKTEMQSDGKTYKVDHDQTFIINCDYIISAFGSNIDTEFSSDQVIKQLEFAHGCLVVKPETGETNVEGIYAGGDVIGSGTVVEASNDGKVAAWGIYTYLRNKQNKSIPSIPSMPEYTTIVDDIDLSVEMCGIKFINPFGLASAPPCTSGEMIARAFEQGWGFAVTKTFTNDVSVINNVTPRIMSSVQGPADHMHWKNGFMNIELISEKSALYWCRAIQSLKKTFPKHVVIASVMSTFAKENWAEIVQQADQAGADAIELNLSCPHGMHEKGMGLALGVYPDKVKQVVEWSCSATKKPVFVKLTPNVTDITLIAAAAKEAGAAGIVAINTVSGLVGFHNDATPMRLGVGKKKMATYGGLCGNNIRPLALKAVSAIAKKFPNFPIMATGGIDSADATLQFLYAGASVMQICSAVMNQDYTIIQDYISGLKMLLYMRGIRSLSNWDHQDPPAEQTHFVRPAFGNEELHRRQNIHKQNIAMESKVTVNDEEKVLINTSMDVDVNNDVPHVDSLVGKGLDHITVFNKLTNKEQVVVTIDDDLCLRCGKCFLTCHDNGYQALEFDPITHIPRVDEDKCTGCGLCESICPAVNCITFKQRDGYKAPDRGDDH